MNKKKLLEIQVTIDEYYSVCGSTGQVNMLLFSGNATGEFFTGKIVAKGTDTQKTSASGDFTLSARYLLEGVDYTGCACKIFIENNGSESCGFQPKIITDSAALRDWESADLFAEIQPAEGGVTVTVYQRFLYC